MSRNYKQFKPGTYRAIFQGLTTPKNGRHRLRFTVLNDELQQSEQYASDTDFADDISFANDFVKTFGSTPHGLKNKTFLVKLGRTSWDMATIICWELSPFELPQWYIEEQEAWQRDPVAKLAYVEQRKLKDPKFRTACGLREKTWESLILGKDHADLLGCSAAELRRHIERQFTKGMNWKNYASLWELDHVIPISKFDLTKPEEVKKAAHFTNLQPLPVEENRRKYNVVQFPPTEVAA
jgi:hypothetical protein